VGITIRAAIARGNGQPLIIDEVTLRAPAAGEVLVQLKASGLCHTDLSCNEGTFPQTMPAILGHEGAGVVVEVGDGVTTVGAGDHVILHNTPHCGRCGPCRSGSTGFCELLIEHGRSAPAFSWRGEPLTSMSRAASFATHTVIGADQVTRIPESMPFESAALVPCGVMTGVGSVMFVAKVRPGSAVIVVGLGSIGLNAVQGARLAGAERIVAVDTNSSKREMALLMGATDFVDPSTLEAPLGKHVRTLVGRWADYAFECVGNTALLRDAIASVHPYYGVCVAVGLPPQDQTIELPASTFFTGRSLLGTFIGDGNPPRDVARLVDWYGAGELTLDELVTDRFAFDDIAAGMEHLKSPTGIRSVVTYT
jgi:S-(hydroxymethyl)glutathione dehydrogenase/alcohol dehydrogenase